MSCLIWNARGLGSPRAFRELSRLLTDYSPQVVFLCETHIKTSRSTNWKNRLGFEGLFVVDPIGRKGGLMILWKDSCQVSILSYSQGHIDCLVHYEGKKWRFTGFYGNPEHIRRKFSWELIRRLNGMIVDADPELAWIIGGDFNEILFENEKQGGCPRPISQLQGFREVLQDCQLYEINHADKSFTWFNKRTTETAVFERLDRYFVNQQWLNSFPEADTCNLDFFGSDHRPVLCQLWPGNNSIYKKGRGRFHWEDKWLLDENLVPDFLAEWERLGEGNSLPRRLGECKNFLRKWAGSRFDMLGKKIVKMRKKRQELMGRDHKVPTQEVLIISAEIEKAVEKESAHWQQRARMNWLKDGDKNTGIFHAKASERRKRNTIQGLFNDRGQWKTMEQDKAKVISDYFEGLYQTSSPSSEDIDNVVNHIEERITAEQGAELDKRFTIEEVRQAIFELHPAKSPGPDGFTGRFYQKFWPTMGDFMAQEILRVMNEEAPLQEWNDTIIALIPKVVKPTLVKEFRPISMCNTSYKVIAKMLVNRLRKVMPTIIDQAQSGFVPGRLITDNVLVGFECIHWLRRQAKRKTGYVALKLDMSKAYDRVEWPYLHAVLIRMGFPTHITNLIMRCVSSVTFSFILNNSVFGKINPSRGLRQGDPLSPFLFVMCAQGISSMLAALERDRFFSGIPIDPGRLSISHLFFADDSLIFFKATRVGCMNIKQSLMAYERASGQMINFEKSAATFSPSINQHDAAMVRQILNINVVQGHAIYLGLPTFSMRQKRIQFGYIRDRVQRKIVGWRARAFSAGGKEVLLKSVVQAVPTYTMSCFRIPESIGTDINRMCPRFWWGDEENHKRMHWAKWEDLCKPKDRGGMGFRDLKSFNKALLAKQVWRMIHNPTSLVSRVFKARYFRDGDIMTAEVRAAASFVWRSLAWSRPLLLKGMYWKVGNGSTIRAYKDAWIPSLTNGILTKMVANHQELKVADLINFEGEWDQEKIGRYCWPHEEEAILAMRIGGQNHVDRRVWKFEENGKYSVKSGYLAQTGYYTPNEHTISHDTKKWQAMIWKLKIPPKVRIFMWRAIKGFIPTEENLLRHHVPTNGICSHCGNHVATTEHCLIFCEKIHMCWKNSRFWTMLKECKLLGFVEIAYFLCHKLLTKEFEVWVILVWMIWHHLCKLKHENEGHQTLVNEEQGWIFWQVCQDATKAFSSSHFLGVQPRERIWQPPENGTYRVDVDALFDPGGKKFGIGVVVRDAKGRIILAMSRPMLEPGSVFHAEMLAVLGGIELCKNEDIHPIALFTDSLLTVRAAAGKDASFEGFSDELQQIRTLVDHGEVSEVAHAYRSATMAAHLLAQHAAQLSSQFLWKNSFSDWLMNVVRSDYIQ